MQRVCKILLQHEILQTHSRVILETFYAKMITESNIVNYLFKTIVENAGDDEETNRTFYGAKYTEYEMLKLCHRKCLKVAGYLDVLGTVLTLLGH